MVSTVLSTRRSAMVAFDIVSLILDAPVDIIKYQAAQFVAAGRFDTILREVPTSS